MYDVSALKSDADADIIATGSSLSESDKRIRKNDDERERLERGFSASGWA